jgi:hypothetical protein
MFIDSCRTHRRSKHFTVAPVVAHNADTNHVCACEQEVGCADDTHQDKEKLLIKNILRWHWRCIGLLHAQHRQWRSHVSASRRLIHTTASRHSRRGTRARRLTTTHPPTCNHTQLLATCTVTPPRARARVYACACACVCARVCPCACACVCVCVCVTSMTFGGDVGTSIPTPQPATNTTTGHEHHNQPRTPQRATNTSPRTRSHRRTANAGNGDVDVDDESIEISVFFVERRCEEAERWT